MSKKRNQKTKKQKIDIALFDAKKYERKLGFDSLVGEKEVAILDEFRECKSLYAMRYTHQDIAYRQLSDSKCIGIVCEGEELSQKTLDRLREYSKLLILSYSKIAQERNRIPILYKMRSAFRHAHKSEVNAAIASLANAPEFLVSHAQLVEVANLITNDYELAKKMTESLGEALNDI